MMRCRVGSLPSDFLFCSPGLYHCTEPTRKKSDRDEPEILLHFYFLHRSPHIVPGNTERSSTIRNGATKRYSTSTWS